MEKLNKKEVLNYLIEYLIMTLKEYGSLYHLTDFGEGAVLAYIECLEILSQWKGFKKFGITDIEAHFGIE